MNNRRSTEELVRGLRESGAKLKATLDRYEAQSNDPLWEYRQRPKLTLVQGGKTD